MVPYESNPRPSINGKLNQIQNISSEENKSSFSQFGGQGLIKTMLSNYRSTVSLAKVTHMINNPLILN